jgi:hypothetical protein
MYMGIPYDAGIYIRKIYIHTYFILHGDKWNGKCSCRRRVNDPQSMGYEHGERIKEAGTSD